MAKKENGVEGNTESPETTEEATGGGGRFRKIETESYMFNAEKTFMAMPPKERLPLTGYLIGLQDMPPIKGREWKAAVILTTEPVNVLDRDKKVVKVPAGSRVLVPATWQLEQHLTKAAMNQKLVYEVQISPNKKIDIGGGQTMWTFNIAANPKPTLRSAFGVAGLLDTGANLPALPAGDVDASVETPF